MDVTVEIDGSDWTDAYYSLSASVGLNRPSKAKVVMDEAPDIGDEVLIRVDGTPFLVGFVRKVKKRKDDLYEVTVYGLEMKLNDRAVWLPAYINTTMDAAIKELLSENLDGNAPWIVAPGSLPTVSVSGLRGIGSRLRLIGDICKMKSTGKGSGHYEWYVDPSSKTFNVVAFRGSETPAVTLEEDVDIDDLEIEPTDETYNKIVVVGASEGDYAVLAVAEDTESQSQVGVREKVIKTSKALTHDEAQEMANAYLKIYTTTTVQGRAVIQGEMPPVSVGDVINIKDSNGITYTVRVTAISIYDGTGETKATLYFSTYDEALDQMIKTVENLQADYITPSGAPNVFHQTKSDNFDASHPVVWRVHIPDDLDKTVKVYLSYKVSDFRNYSRSGSGSTTDENPKTESFNVDGVTNTPKDPEEYDPYQNFATITAFEWKDNTHYDFTEIDSIQVPSSITDYTTFNFHFSVHYVADELQDNNLAYNIFFTYYAKNKSRNIVIPSVGTSPASFQLWTQSHPYKTTETMGFASATLCGGLSFVVPPYWAGDTIAVYGKPSAGFSGTWKATLYGGIAITSFEKHKHEFTSYYTKADLPTRPVSVTNSAEITTAPLSGTVTVKITDPENNTYTVYSGSATEYTAEVTNYVKPGWNTVTFSSTGKGFVDMVLEAKGRLKTFTNP